MYPRETPLLRPRHILILFNVVIFACGSASMHDDQTLILRAGTSQLTVRAPSSEEEFNYLERTLGDLDFFRSNNYDVALPGDPRFNGAAEIPELRSDDRQAAFVEAVFDPGAYQPALAALGDHRLALETALQRISSWSAYPGFAPADSAVVILTLYGPGGSFDPDAARIILWTNEDASFKGGGGVHTIIHELVHIVVEHGIARPHQLEHWERERLVDLLAQREFQDLLPDYRLQQGDDAPLDDFIRNVDLANVREAVGRYAAAR